LTLVCLKFKCRKHQVSFFYRRFKADISNFQQRLEELYHIELAISQEAVVIKYLCRDHQVRKNTKKCLECFSQIFTLPFLYFRQFFYSFYSFLFCSFPHILKIIVFRILQKKSNTCFLQMLLRFFSLLSAANVTHGVAFKMNTLFLFLHM